MDRPPIATRSVSEGVAAASRKPVPEDSTEGRVMQNSCRRTQSARRRSSTRVALAKFVTGCVFACCLFPAIRLSAAPPTLLTGIPKVPDVGNIDADLIRVSAEVDDTDDLAIYPDKLQWRHRR